MKKLKTCPFCETMALSCIKTGDGYSVECKNQKCIACGPIRDTEDKARKAWDLELEFWKINDKNLA